MRSHRDRHSAAAQSAAETLGLRSVPKRNSPELRVCGAFRERMPKSPSSACLGSGLFRPHHGNPSSGGEGPSSPELVAGGPELDLDYSELRKRRRRPKAVGAPQRLGLQGRPEPAIRSRSIADCGNAHLYGAATQDPVWSSRILMAMSLNGKSRISSGAGPCRSKPSVLLRRNLRLRARNAWSPGVPVLALLHLLRPHCSVSARARLQDSDLFLSLISACCDRSPPRERRGKHSLCGHRGTAPSRSRAVSCTAPMPNRARPPRNHMAIVLGSRAPLAGRNRCRLSPV